MLEKDLNDWKILIKFKNQTKLINEIENKIRVSSTVLVILKKNY